MTPTKPPTPARAYAEAVLDQYTAHLAAGLRLSPEAPRPAPLATVEVLDAPPVVEDALPAPPAGWGVQALALGLVRRDGGTQARTGNSEETVEAYTVAMRDRADFPAVIVCWDGEGYWLADGFHRVEAAQRAGHATIRAEVLRGGRRAALLRAAGANAEHGLPRTRADVRRACATLLRDTEWGGWSDRAIARQVRCHHETVGVTRRELESGGEIATSIARRGGDGKNYQIGTAGGEIATSATPGTAATPSESDFSAARVDAAHRGWYLHSAGSGYTLTPAHDPAPNEQEHFADWPALLARAEGLPIRPSTPAADPRIAFLEARAAFDARTARGLATVTGPDAPPDPPDWDAWQARARSLGGRIAQSISGGATLTLGGRNVAWTSAAPGATWEALCQHIVDAEQLGVAAADLSVNPAPPEQFAEAQRLARGAGLDLDWRSRTNRFALTEADGSESGYPPLAWAQCLGRLDHLLAQQEASATRTAAALLPVARVDEAPLAEDTARYAVAERVIRELIDALSPAQQTLLAALMLDDFLDGDDAPEALWERLTDVADANPEVLAWALPETQGVAS